MALWDKLSDESDATVITGTLAGGAAGSTPAFEAAGAGSLTATSGAALSPAIPGGTTAGKILIAHVFFGDNTTAPSTPAGWTLLDGPRDLTTPATNGRTWVFGKIADGSDVAPAFGTPAVTTPRRARVYRFSNPAGHATLGAALGGWGFAAHNTATFPNTGVTTDQNNALAVNLVAQADDTPAAGAFSGETGGDWVEAVAEFTGTTGTPDTLLQLQTASVDAQGTIDGGTFASGSAINRGVTGFFIRGTAGTPSSIAAGRVSLGPGGEPDTRTAHNVKVRARKTAGTGTVVVRAALYEGASNRSGDLGSSALTTSLAEYTLAIANADAEDITDYGNLELRLWAVSTTGDAVDVEIAEAWLETPASTIVHFDVPVWEADVEFVNPVVDTTGDLHVNVPVWALPVSTPLPVVEATDNLNVEVPAWSVHVEIPHQQVSKGYGPDPFTVTVTTPLPAYSTTQDLHVDVPAWEVVASTPLPSVFLADNLHVEVPAWTISLDTPGVVVFLADNLYVDVVHWEIDFSTLLPVVGIDHNLHFDIDSWSIDVSTPPPEVELSDNLEVEIPAWTVLVDAPDVVVGTTDNLAVLVQTWTVFVEFPLLVVEGLNDADVNAVLPLTMTIEPASVRGMTIEATPVRLLSIDPSNRSMTIEDNPTDMTIEDNQKSMTIENR